MGTLKKLASQTAVYGLSQILGRFVNYLLVPLYTTLFSPAEYGVVTLLYAYVTFFNVLLTYGMETAFFRFAAKNNPDRVYSTALTSILGTSAFFVLLALFLHTWLAGLIDLGDHPEYITWFVLIIALDAIAAIPFALLRQQEKPLRFAIIRNINIFSNILLNLYFLLLCPYAQQTWQLDLPFYAPEIGIGYIFISNLVASAITIPLLGKEILAIRSASFDRALWKEMLAYALPLMVVGFAGMINETLDRTLITELTPDPQTGKFMNGIYGANYKLSILMSLFIQAFRYAAEPFFFSHARSDDKRTIYAHVMNYFVLVCLFLFLCVTLFIDLFQYFIGRDFREGLHIVPVLLLANMFLGIYYNLSIWYKLSDKTGMGAWISVAGAGITIVMNVLLIPVYGYTGSAWATFVCYLSMMLICYVLGQKYYPIPYQTLRLVGYILFALLIYSLSSWLSPLISGWIRHLFHAGLLLGFCGVMWWAERRQIGFFA